MNNDRWDDPPAVRDTEPGDASNSGDSPPEQPYLGGFVLALVAVLYSVFLMGQGEYGLMLAALLAGMALYLGIVVVAVAREGSL